MKSVRKTEKLLKTLLAKHERRVKQIKSKLSAGQYKVKNDKVAEAICVSIDSGLAVLRVVADDLN